jgi:hypothetical protein
MDPGPRGLPVHPGSLSGLVPGLPFQDQRHGQQPPDLPGVEVSAPGAIAMIGPAGLIEMVNGQTTPPPPLSFRDRT